MATTSRGISSGLFDYVYNFMALHPNTKMLVIDTLERIRDTELTKTLYSCDYKDITALREITDRYELTLLLIHHTRKMHDDDPLNTLSGSMGLVGNVHRLRNYTSKISCHKASRSLNEFLKSLCSLELWVFRNRIT